MNYIISIVHKKINSDNTMQFGAYTVPYVLFPAWVVETLGQRLPLPSLDDTQCLQGTGNESPDAAAEVFCLLVWTIVLPGSLLWSVVQESMIEKDLVQLTESRGTRHTGSLKLTKITIHEFWLFKTPAVIIIANLPLSLCIIELCKHWGVLKIRVCYHEWSMYTASSEVWCIFC